MIRQLLAILAPGFLLWTTSSRAQGTDSLPLQAIQFIEGGPGDWIGNTRDRIVTALGRPNGVEVRTIRNQDDTLATDSIVTLHYAAATFVLYVATTVHSDFLAEATVWGAAYLKQSPIKLGATLLQVRAYFGDTSRGPTPQLVYSHDTPLPHRLELWFENNKLVRLQWEYPVD
jgi:hypothetical protein